MNPMINSNLFPQTKSTWNPVFSPNPPLRYNYEAERNYKLDLGYATTAPQPGGWANPCRPAMAMVYPHLNPMLHP
jgi:hypothetical protein